MPSEDLLPPRAAACVLYVFLLLTLVVQRVRAQPPLTSPVPVYAPLPLAEWELAERRALREHQYRDVDLSEAHALAPPRIDAAERPWAKRLWRDVLLVGCLSDSFCHPDTAFASALLQAAADGKLHGAYTTGVTAPPTRLRLREDWVWDGSHGTMRTVLSGIGLATGARSGDLILWVPMTAARSWLAQQAVESANLDELGWSWYDVLTMRAFTGQVMRFSNPMDMDVVDQASGEFQQQASDQIDAWLERREAYFWELLGPVASP